MYFFNVQLTFTAKASLNLVQDEKSVLPSLGHPTRPEEDILFQWRLRRKMEQARDWPQPLNHSDLQSPAFSWQALNLSSLSSAPSAGGQAQKVGVHDIFFQLLQCLFQIYVIIWISSFFYHLQQQQGTQPPDFALRNTHSRVMPPEPEVTEAPHRSCPPTSGPSPSPAYVVSGSSVPRPHSVGHVPAHMHLLCDLLPCPIQSTHALAQQNISQRLDEYHNKAVTKKTRVTGDSTDIVTDAPICEHISSSAHAPCGAIEKERPLNSRSFELHNKEKAQIKESEENEKTSTSTRKQKKSTR